MNYKKKYKNMKPGDKGQDGIIRGETSIPCLMCGRPTEFVDICSEGRFCSEECRTIFYDMMKE